MRWVHSRLKIFGIPLFLHRCWVSINGGSLILVCVMSFMGWVRFSWIHASNLTRKDFCCNGFRLGVLISQSNPQFLKAIGVIGYTIILPLLTIAAQVGRHLSLVSRSRWSWMTANSSHHSSNSTENGYLNIIWFAPPFSKHIRFHISLRMLDFFSGQISPNLWKSSQVGYLLIGSKIWICGY